MGRLSIVLVCLCCLSGCQPVVEADRTPPTIEVRFSPRGGCTDAVVSELDAAKNRVLVQAYSFTSAPIAKALVEAHKRGVDVRVILDDSQRSEKYTSADFVAHAGIPTFIDAKHAIAHNKVMVIDGETIITGSFNFTKAAEEKNAENLLVIRDAALAKKYEDNWRRHWEHSEEYQGRGGR
jgi:phosphatidylserine/phosphatidylglycerophosphate/cardiolipin synthase-like enzyme